MATSPIPAPIRRPFDCEEWEIDQLKRQRGIIRAGVFDTVKVDLVRRAIVEKINSRAEPLENVLPLQPPPRPS